MSASVCNLRAAVSRVLSTEPNVVTTRAQHERLIEGGHRHTRVGHSTRVELHGEVGFRAQDSVIADAYVLLGHHPIVDDDTVAFFAYSERTQVALV